MAQASNFGTAGSDQISLGLINARSIKNKFFVLNDLLVSRHLDLLLIRDLAKDG